MKLPSPFIRLPLRFDAERLAAEVLALPSSAWASHPNDFPGNTAARLISVEGGENDEVTGRMEMTPHLQSCPYIQQILAHFGVVWGRSRLMRLAPGAHVPEHADMNYHWFSRVRVHIPVITRPGVHFFCGDEVVYMAPGEAWIFDNWRLHRVENATPEQRIHLVADTSGSAAFWNMVSSGQQGAPARIFGYQPAQQPRLALERFNSFRVMPPSEVELLLTDLAGDLQLIPGRAGTAADQAQFQSLLHRFCADWRQVWLLHGDSNEGLDQFLHLSQALREVTQPYGSALCTKSNQLPAMRVLDARVIRYLVHEQQAALSPLRDPCVPGASKRRAAGPQPAIHRTDAPALSRLPDVERPVFIVAAPRSGSTLLFETLACTPQFWTVGAEAHWLVEGFDHLAPGAIGIEDNRIDARYATRTVSMELKRRLTERLRGPSGQPFPQDAHALRVLEKTPKNSLRIPFLAHIFPDALFIFLWRDPRENISSIMEAWKSGGWVTYSELPDWEGEWSMLLPPGWRSLKGKSLADIAAFQWESTNRIALDDLSLLPPDQWVAVNYAEFIADPEAMVRKLSNFCEIEVDSALQDRVDRPLPISRHTLTKPAPQKWRTNQEIIEPQLPSLQATWNRLTALKDLSA